MSEGLVTNPHVTFPRLEMIGRVRPHPSHDDEAAAPSKLWRGARCMPDWGRRSRTPARLRRRAGRNCGHLVARRESTVISTKSAGVTTDVQRRAPRVTRLSGSGMPTARRETFSADSFTPRSATSGPSRTA